MTAIAPSNSRGMSWRKPVPAFIPTPPTSRPTSETWFTSAPVVSNGNADKEPTIVASPGDGPSRRPPVSPLFHIPPLFPVYPGECKRRIDSSQKMPDNWLSIVRSASQDFYGDGSRLHRTPGSGIPERQPVYAVCHTRLTLQWSGLSAQCLFLGAHPGCVFDG